MKSLISTLAPFLLLTASPALAQSEDEEMAKLDAEIAADEEKERQKRASAGDILDAAPAEHWLAIPASDLMVFTLPDAPDGTKRETVIQLLPAILSGGHVRNVRKLAKGRWWDGTKIYRVAENFVTQFGGNADNKALPKSLEKVPESEYYNAALGAKRDADMAALKAATDYSNEHQGTEIKPLMKTIYEGYGAKVGYGGGWPIGSKTVDGVTRYYPIKCRGALSPAHYDPPDAGTGAEISIITGEEARGLDTTFGMVGRVIDGLEHLVNLPPGDAAGGFYASKAKHTRIKSIRLVSELPPAEQPRYEYLASNSPVLLQYIAASNDYGHICSTLVPVRKVSG